MGQSLRIHGLVAGLLVVLVPLAAYAAPKKPAAAKESPPAEEQGEDTAAKSGVLVQQIFEGGVKAYGVGKYEEAMRAFEAAIRAGMPSNQMPRVLYYRGLTFRKLGKPGFAVSDLTSALWLKGGLSEAERADAVKNRALAYNESGVADVPPVPKSAYAEAPAMPGRDKAAVAAAAMPSNAPAASTSSSNSGSGIGGFFSNLFGGGSSSESPPAPTATASLATPSASDADTGWGASTEVVSHVDGAAPSRGPEVATPYVSQVASASEPEAAPRTSVGGSGGIRLQVAAVRSRSEADALADLLVGRHAEELNGRKPEVDQTVIGSMGTFYRVRLGPYANDREPQKLCNALKSDGFDCLVVTE
jgi:hypothetical protein